MKKYNIHINRKPISSEEIAKGKDFQAVLKGAKLVSKPVYKKTWFKANVFVVIVAVTAIFIFEDNKKETITAPKQNPKPFISPAFENTDIASNSYKINSDSLQEIVYKTGSKITIPANAFVDKNGKPVNGIVEIKYREMHNVKDIFLSGIPMEYDSAGTKYNLESAGMLDIKGFKNGEEIFIAPNKSIAIDMISQKEGSKYNVYELDTTKKNWVFKGKDKITIIKPNAKLPESKIVEAEIDSKSEKIQNEITKISNEIIEVKKEEPLKPEKAISTAWTFNIAVNPEEFPEAAIYKNSLWAVDESEKKFDPSYAKIVWEDVLISKSENKNYYTITFKRTNQNIQYSAKLVFKGKDYDNAMKIYDKKFVEYSEKLATRKRQEQLKKDEFAKRQQELNAQIAKNNQRTPLITTYINPLSEDQQLAILETNLNYYNNKNFNTEQIIRRSFEIQNFGIWNSDYPKEIQNESKYDVTFVDATNKIINLQTVKIINKSVNTVYHFYRQNSDNYSIKFNNKANNMIIAVTTDNKIAILKYVDFKSLFSTNKVISQITLQIIDHNITKEQDFKDLYDGDFNETIVNKQVSAKMKNEKLTISASPNPCSNKVALKVNLEKQYTGEILTYSGMVVKRISFNGSETEIETSDLVKGTYLIKLVRNEDNDMATTRIVKL